MWCPARRPSNPITVINSVEVRTSEPPSVLQRRRLARGMRLPMLTCSWTKCWSNSRLWQRMAPGRCDPGQSRRWPEQRSARLSWRSGEFVSVAGDRTAVRHSVRHTLWAARLLDSGLPQVLGSCSYGHRWMRTVGWSEPLSKVGTESAIIDSVTNLKQQIGAAPRPSHLLRFVHPTIHQEIGHPSGDRGANS